MKLLLIIPAYNEEKNIERVVNKLIKDYPQYDYVVVNDGSNDHTADICKKNNYNLLDLPINLGLSGAFQAGMLYAYRRGGYDYAIQYDGDGQHDPRYVEEMLDEASRNGWNITIGSRFLGTRKPLSLRMMGSRIIQLSIFLTSGKKLSDPTSGMRLYDKRMIAILAQMMNCSPEPDTITFLMKCGAKVGEVKVEMNEREAGQSYLNITNSIKYMFNVCASIWIIQWFRKKVRLE